MPIPNDTTRAAAALHERLVFWLRQHEAQTPLPIVLAALTYEIARILALAADEGDGEGPDITSVILVMEEQIRAHRAGKLPRE